MIAQLRSRLKSQLTLPRPGSGKWWLYALAVLAPGSFVVLPALWLLRLAGQALRNHSARTADAVR